jgi:Flp pilus assembly protein TadD
VSSPLGTAVEQIKLGRLPDALTTINGVLRTDNQNANAHYLKAVVSVLSRRFTDARMEYLATLKFSHSAELSERARVGLTKLTR